jgi:hypothetical protein
MTLRVQITMSASGQSRPIRDAREASGLPPTPDVSLRRSEPTLGAMRRHIAQSGSGRTFARFTATRLHLLDVVDKSHLNVGAALGVMKIH